MERIEVLKELNQIKKNLINVRANIQILVDNGLYGFCEDAIQDLDNTIQDITSEIKQE